MNKMAALESKLESVGIDLIQKIMMELNQRAIGGEVFQANDILNQIRDLSDSMKRQIDSIGGMQVRAAGLEMIYLMVQQLEQIYLFSIGVVESTLFLKILFFQQ